MEGGEFQGLNSGSPRFTVGPLHPPGDTTLSEEESSFRKRFCEAHQIPAGEVGSATLRDEGGRTIAVLLIVGIGRMRELARASPLYLRSSEPVIERDSSGWPAAATMKVFRTNSMRATARTAFWQERIPLEPSEEVRKMWREEPDRMLSEAAESLALRTALPEVLAGIYTLGDLDEAPRDFELALQARLPGPLEW